MQLLIITPFKNEANSILKTMDSIVRQTMHPVKWLLIDDGSDDESPRMVQEYQAKYPFIHYHRRQGASAQRATGNNVVDVFNAGLKVADELGLQWDLVGKMDADLVIDRDDYLEFIVRKFDEYPKLGIASGVIYTLSNTGKKIYESPYRWHTQGQTKFYRRNTLEAMGGLKPFKGWDGIDNILARGNGYITEKFFEQEILHLYPTQTRMAEGGFKKGLKREATEYRNMGYPFYMYFFKTLKLIKERGIYPGILYFYYGLKATLTTKPLVNSQEQAVIKAFISQRWKNNFVYTGDSK
ncbi:glycosyltransferase family 2 protein [Pedobacter sp. SAFR-022]|uniref:glycosyltransferase family 2 protein n=1 Tax=Pedobacter sp. SAFR-022 TaxID=3436861 RepID=UPI003F804E66